MAIERRPGLFYELMIRGNFSAEHQDKGELGSFAGAHYIEGEAVVDTDTREVVQYKPGVPQELSREKVIDYLGEKFTTFEAGQRQLTQTLETAQRDLAEAKAACDAATAERDSLAKRLARLYERINALTATDDTPPATPNNSRA